MNQEKSDGVWEVLTLSKPMCSRAVSYGSDLVCVIEIHQGPTNDDDDFSQSRLFLFLELGRLKGTLGMYVPQIAKIAVRYIYIYI